MGICLAGFVLCMICVYGRRADRDFIWLSAGLYAYEMWR